MNRFSVEFFVNEIQDVYVLSDTFETFEEAERRASVIALNGFKGCLNRAEMIFIPVHRIDSVFVRDVHASFVPNVIASEERFFERYMEH